jgi:hypothetical protein
MIGAKAGLAPGMPSLYREKRRAGASACFAVTVEGMQSPRPSTAVAYATRYHPKWLCCRGLQS